MALRFGGHLAVGTRASGCRCLGTASRGSAYAGVPTVVAPSATSHRVAETFPARQLQQQQQQQPRATHVTGIPAASAGRLPGLEPAAPRLGSGPGSLAQSTRTSTPTVAFAPPSAASSSAKLAEPSPSLAAWWRRQQDSQTSVSASSLDPGFVSRLSLELEQAAGDVLPREAHIAQKDEFLRRLQHHLKDVVDGAEVASFGSAVNGFWTAHSDVDICVRVPGASTRNAQIQVLRRIAGELARVSTHHIEPRFGAQVPILHWAPQRVGMVATDISVNNILAVVNSRLLGRYVEIDGRLRTLGLCLKLWAQARGINDRSRGTISSFALSLLLVNFLQHRDPPVLPSLQDIAFSRSMPSMFVAGVDCRYCTDPAEIEREMVYLRGKKPPNGESVGLLLCEFFRHYARDYRSGIIRIRDTRAFLPPVDESKLYLVVDNPFEVGKDVANIDESQHDCIRKEFRRAWSLLSRGRGFRELVQSPSLEETQARQRKVADTKGNRRGA